MTLNVSNLNSITINQAGVGSASSNSLKPICNERIVLVSSSIFLHAGGLLDLFGLS